MVLCCQVLDLMLLCGQSLDVALQFVQTWVHSEFLNKIKHLDVTSATHHDDKFSSIKRNNSFITTHVWSPYAINMCTERKIISYQYFPNYVMMVFRQSLYCIVFYILLYITIHNISQVSVQSFYSMSLILFTRLLLTVLYILTNVY